MGLLLMLLNCKLLLGRLHNSFHVVLASVPAAEQQQPIECWLQVAVEILAGRATAPFPSLPICISRDGAL